MLSMKSAPYYRFDVKEGPEMSPIRQADQNDYYGNSRYDKDLSQVTSDEWEKLYDNPNELRAQNQGTLSKWGSGLAKMVSLAGTTFLDGTVGLVFGAGQALTEGRWSAIFDNKLSNALQEWNDYMEKALPNYRTQEEMERPWYQNLGTANFWADNILKNAGFTIGAFYSGNAWLGALRGFNWVKRGATANMIGSLVSGVNEGRIEGNNARRDYLNLESQKLDDQTELLRQQILASDMSDVEKANALQDLDIRKQQLYQDIVDRSERVGMETLGWNVPLLTMGNMWQFGKLYARGFEEASDMTKRIIAKGGVEKTMTQRVAENIGYDFKEMGKTSMTLKGVSNAAWEAQEEMSQGLVSAAAAHRRTPDSPDSYYKALVDDDAQMRFAERADVWSRAFADTYGNPDMWQEGFAGFVMGAFGMPTVGKMQNSSAKTYLGRGKTIGLSGGILGDIFEAREMNRKGNETVEAMNKYIDKLSKDKQHFIRSESFTNDMDGYAAEGDKFEYINAKDNDDFEAIKYFNEAGRINDYKEAVNQPYENMSHEVLEDIAKRMTPDISYDNDGKLITKDAEGNVLRGGYRNTDGTLMTDTEEGTEKMRQELIEKRDKALKGIEQYVQSYQKVVSNVGDKLNDDQLNELAWLDWKVNAFSERYNEVKDKVKPFAEGIINRTNELLEQMNDESLHIVRGMTRGTEEFNKNKELLENVRDTFTDLINSKNALAFADNVRANSELLALVNMGDFALPGSVLKLYGNLAAIDKDYNKRFKEMYDLAKLAASAKSFNDKYEEYTQNPEKLQENRNKINAKEAKKKEDKIKQENEQDLSTKSVQDLVADDLGMKDFSLDDLEKSAQSEENKAKVRKAKDIINKANQMKEAVRQQASDPDSSVKITDLEDYNAMIDEMAKRVDSPEQLDDVASQTFSDIIDGAIDPTVDDIDKARADLLNIFRGISDISKVISEEAAKVPKEKSVATLEYKEDTGHDGEAKGTPENEKKPEKTEERPLEPGVSQSFESSRDINEEITIPTSSDAEVNVLDSLNEENKLPEIAGTYMFWRSNTSQYPYNSHRSWITLKEYAKKYSEALRKKVEAVYDKLVSSGAFDAKNSPQKGDKLRFQTFNDVNEKAGETIIFLVDKNGNIVGDLASLVSGDGVNRYAALEDFIKRFKSNYEKAGSKDGYILSDNGNDVTVTVEKLLTGKPMYSPERRNLNTVFSNSENQLIIGVIVDDNGNVRTSRGSAKVQDAYSKVTLPARGIRKGTPVILLKTSDNKGRRQYIPVPFDSPLFSTEALKGTKRYDKIVNVLNDIVSRAKGESTTDMVLLLQRLQDNIANEFRLDIMNNGNIRLKERDSGKELVNTTPDNFVSVALKALEGMSLQISRKFINTKDYNEEVGEFAEVNLSSTHTVNDGFITTYINSKGEEVKADTSTMNSKTGKKDNKKTAPEQQENSEDLSTVEPGNTPVSTLEYQEESKNNSVAEFYNSLSPNNKLAFDALTDSQKQTLANNPNRNQLINILYSKYSKRTKSFREGTDVDSIIGTSNKETTNKKEESVTQDFSKVIPNLTKEENKKLEDAMKVASKNVNLLSYYETGLILAESDITGEYLNTAFNAICEILLDSDTKNKMIESAKMLYGNKQDTILMRYLSEDYKVFEKSDTSKSAYLNKVFRQISDFAKKFNEDNIAELDNIVSNMSRSTVEDKSISQRVMSTFNEIAQVNVERYQINNLKPAESQYLKESGMTTEEFNKMTTEEKERFFKCRV